MVECILGAYYTSEITQMNNLPNNSNLWFLGPETDYTYIIRYIYHTYVHPLLHTVKNKVNIEKQQTASTNGLPGGVDQITSEIQ